MLTPDLDRVAPPFEHLAAMTQTKYAVMKLYGWKSVKLDDGRPLQPKPGEPKHFLLVFDTRKEAVAFVNGDERAILAIDVVGENEGTDWRKLRRPNPTKANDQCAA